MPRNAFRTRRRKRYMRRGRKARQAVYARNRRRARPRRPLPLTGFPRSKMVRLRYAEEISVDCGLNTVASAVYNASGLYDPRVAAGGHQPKGYDQWATIYNHYTVVGARMNVRYMPDTNGDVLPGFITIMLTANGTTASALTPEEVLESKWATRKGMVGLNTGNAWPINRGVTKNFSAKKFFGTRGIVGKDLYRGDNTTNPTESAYFEIVVGSLGGNNPGAVNLVVTIDYIAVMSEPINLSQS